MTGRWLIAVALVAAACGGGVSTAPEDGVRIASFDFAESELLAELYAQSLESAGLDVVRLGSVGPREIVAPALEQGRVDLVPEYLGTASTYFGAESPTLAALEEALRPRGLAVLDPAPAQDVNVFVVTAATAERYALVSLSDLAPVADTFRVGGPVECPDRPLCLGGLTAVYGLEFDSFTPHRSLAITAEALVRDEVDLGVMFSTSAELSSGPFVVLDDDRGLQPPENVIPVVRQDVLDRLGAGFASTVTSMSRRLTTAELQAMNRRIADDEPIETVAHSWLESVADAASDDEIAGG